MAINRWTGATSSAVQTTTNWSAGTAAADTEDLFWSAAATNDCTGDARVADLTDIDPNSMRFIGGFDQDIGADASNPLKFADVATTVEVDLNPGPNQRIWLDITSTVNLIVRQTSGNAEGFYLVDGNITGEINITGGNVIFGAGVTFGAACEIRINHEGSATRPYVKFLAGATMNVATRMYIGNAVVDSLTPLAGIVDIHPRGVLNHKPTSGTPTLANVNCWGELNIVAGVATIVTLIKAGDRARVTTSGAAGVTFTASKAFEEAYFDTRPILDVYTAAGVTSGKGYIPGGTPLTSA